MNALKSWTGPEGIEHYLSAETKGSLKSFLSSRTLRGMEVFGRRHTLEDLIAKMLRPAPLRAEGYLVFNPGDGIASRALDSVRIYNACHGESRREA